MTRRERGIMTRVYFIIFLLLPTLGWAGGFFTDQSVLATGNWYKVAVNQTGIHQVTYDDLVLLGMDPTSFNPTDIRLYGNGGGMLSEANNQPRIDDLAGNGASLFVHTARQKRNRFVAIIVCMALLTSVGLLITGSTVQGDANAHELADAHGMIEWIGALFGLVVGLALVMHFAALGNRLYLFIGLAFFVNGAEGDIGPSRIKARVSRMAEEDE